MAEGDDDLAFLRHIKKLFGQGNGGFTITIKNAHGKGAEHVIDKASRHKKQSGYTRIASFFDTDEGWGPSARKKAKGIIILPSETCLEAMLLRIVKEPVLEGENLKKRFAPLVDNKPGLQDSYQARFPLSVLQEARDKEPTIDRLLQLFETGDCANEPARLPPFSCG